MRRGVSIIASGPPLLAVDTLIETKRAWHKLAWALLLILIAIACSALVRTSGLLWKLWDLIPWRLALQHGILIAGTCAMALGLVLAAVALQRRSPRWARGLLVLLAATFILCYVQLFCAKFFSPARGYWIWNLIVGSTVYSLYAVCAIGVYRIVRDLRREDRLTRSTCLWPEVQTCVWGAWSAVVALLTVWFHSFYPSEMAWFRLTDEQWSAMYAWWDNVNRIAALAWWPLTAWLFLSLLIFHRRFRIATREGACPACGYDLRGDFAGGCPECGWNRKGTGAGTM